MLSLSSIRHIGWKKRNTRSLTDLSRFNSTFIAVLNTLCYAIFSSNHLLRERLHILFGYGFFTAAYSTINGTAR